MRNILLLLACILITGCATFPTQLKIPTKDELAKMDYGTTLTVDYEKTIKEYFNKSLKDPYSAHYKIGTPHPFWFRESPINGNKEYTGYAVDALVNAKNSFGGYIGEQKYTFIFRNNIIVKIVTPEDYELMKPFLEQNSY